MIADLFTQLVSIPSPSRHESTIREWVLNYLRERHIDAQVDDYGNVYFTNPQAKLLLTAHLDTVQEDKLVHPVINNDRITSDGTSILGADDKANLTAILTVVDSYFRDHKPYDFEILLTVEEEVGMQGSKHFDFTKLNSKRAITFDKSGTQMGNIVVRGPYGYSVKILLTGKEAHASTPEQGVSALSMATSLLTKVPLGGKSGELTFNLGTAKGGTVANAVMGELLLHGDIRSRTGLAAIELIDKLKKAADEVAATYGGTINITANEVVSGFDITDSIWLQEAVQTIEQVIGRKPEHLMVTSGSDAAVLMQQGIETLLIASGAQRCHSTEEYITVSDLEALPKILLALMSK